MRKVLLLAGLLAALVLPATANAAFPGANGKIAFSDIRDDPNPSGCYPDCNSEIYSINPNGTGVTRLTNSPGYDVWPTWSPDGQKIAFVRFTPDPEIIVMNADGTGQTPIGQGFDPSWSPDGSKIVFVADGTCGDQSGGVHTMNPDGTGDAYLACGPSGPGQNGEADPAWSPDGALIAFTADLSTIDIFSVHADGTSRVNLTASPSEGDDDSNWSPDGTKIAWGSGEFSVPDIWAMNRDGSTPTKLTNDAADDREPAYSPDGTKVAFWSSRNPVGLQLVSSTGGAVTALTTGESPDWQPIPINTYPRPKGATPFRTTLVPAAKQCTAPSSTHGAPLAFGSCNPPALASQYLTTGTPDANGRAARMNAFLLVKVQAGNTSTPADEADLIFKAQLNDVDKLDLSDYTGTLRTSLSLRITDRLNTPSPGGPGAATTTTIPYGFNVPCTADPSAIIGSDCSITTTADSLVPGTITEGVRSIWQLGQAQIFDGGADGNGSTTGDNTLYAVQGIFVP